MPAPLFLAKWLHRAMPSPRGAVASLACRMPCCLTSRAMAISFLHRSTGAAPKPSPRGEDAELCSPDAVEASRLPPVPSGACLTSSLVCFCITCQAFFLSAEKPVSAPGAAPASRTNGRHAAPRPTVPHHAAPRPACPAPAPFPAAAGFPQSFHRVFHIFAGFPQRLSFPLAFLERDSVRSSEPWVLPAA